MLDDKTRLEKKTILKKGYKALTCRGILEDAGVSVGKVID